MLIGELAAALAMTIAYATMALLMALEVAFALLAFVLELVVSFATRDRDAGKRVGAGATAASEAAAKRRAWLVGLARSKWVRRVGIGAGACLGLTIAAALLLNFVFFEWTVGKLLGGVAGRSGITITHGGATGNLFTGRLQLNNAVIARSAHPTMVFDLRATEMAVDLNVRSMIWGERRIEDIRLVGLRGRVEQIGEAEGERTPWYARKTVHLERLHVADAEVEWVDHTRRPRARAGTPTRAPRPGTR